MFKWLRRFFMRKPKCDCGAVLEVDKRLCLTSFPCQHGAKCPKCQKSYMVYGIGDHVGFTRDWDEAVRG